MESAGHGVYTGLYAGVCRDRSSCWRCSVFHRICAHFCHDRPGMGYDALVGVSLVLLGGAVGAAAGPITPFTTGVARELQNCRCIPACLTG